MPPTAVCPACRLAALLVLAAGCGGSGDRPADATRAAGAPAAAGTIAGAPAGAPAPSPLDPRVEGDSATCPKDGRWRQCGVADRLRHAGLVPQREPGVARLPFLSVPGAVWTVDRAEVRAFVYADDALARREGLALDPFTAAPRGQPYAWPRRATLVRSANLIAVLLAENERQIERVQLALEAGPPPPETPAAPQALPAATAR